jgi:hypothetical protein
MVCNKSKDESEKFLRDLITHTLLFPLSNQVREEDKGKYVHHIPLLFFIKKEEIGNEVAQPL